MTLVIMIIGAAALSQAGSGGMGTIFFFAWIAIGLIGAGISFYNAFSEEGVSLYEIDLEGSDRAGTTFCPKCGSPVQKTDQFCRNCGAPLNTQS